MSQNCESSRLKTCVFVAFVSAKINKICQWTCNIGGVSKAVYQNISWTIASKTIEHLVEIGQ